MKQSSIIIIILTVFVAILIIAVICMCCYRDNQQYKEGMQIYFPGFSRPMYIEQYTEDLSISIDGNQFSRQLSKINGIPMDVYKLAMTKHFVLPCYVKSRNTHENLFRIAVFYDANNKHYVKLIKSNDNDDAINGYLCTNCKNARDVSFSPTEQSNTMVITRYDTKFKLNEKTNKIQILIKVSGNWVPLIDHAKTLTDSGIAFFLENSLYPWGGDVKGSLFPFILSNCNGFSGIYMTKNNDMVVLRNQKHNVDKLLTDSFEEKRINIYHRYYWFLISKT